MNVDHSQQGDGFRKLVTALRVRPAARTCTSMRTTSRTALTGAAAKTPMEQAISSVQARLTGLLTKTGETYISDLEKAAAVLGSEEVPARAFVKAVFYGEDPESVTSLDRHWWTRRLMYDGHLTRHQVLQYAKEWDEWGPSDMPSFVNSLACDTIGRYEHDALLSTLRQLDEIANRINAPDPYEYGSDLSVSIHLQPGLCTNEALDRAGW